MPERAKFSKIVAAFDGSKDSIKAVQLASSMSSMFGAELTLIHVFASPSVAFSAASGMPPPDYGEMEAASKEAGAATLATGVRLASEAGVKARGELLESSSVVEAIVGFSENWHADLIVVGTRGMTGFKRLILGSVSSGLVSHAHCPVLVVR